MGLSSPPFEGRQAFFTGFSFVKRRILRQSYNFFLKMFARMEKYLYLCIAFDGKAARNDPESGSPGA